ncbi:restriction endonuclease subunit S [Spirosoma areae]
MTTWQNGRLKNFIVLQRGHDLTDDQLQKGEYPVVKSNGIDGYHSEFKVKAPGVTTGRSGTIGNVFYVEKDFWPHNTSLYVKDFKGNDPKFFYYLIQSLKFEQYYAGTTVPTLNRNDVHKIKVSVPEVDEQRAIASILTKVDEAIEATRRSIQAAERLKRALMQNLLTGKLKPDGTPRTDDEFYTDTKFGKVPVGWVIAKGWQITSLITKGQSPKWQGFEYQDTGTLFITSENVRDGFLDLSDPKYLPIEFNVKLKNSQLRQNDILINIVGASIGRSCIFHSTVETANINQAVCLFRPSAENDNLFISYYLQWPETVNRLLGSQVETARANLSLSDFRQFKFCIPNDLIEQKLIAKNITSFELTIKFKQTKITTLERLKKSLMQNLLTGKVRVAVDQLTEPVPL